MSILEIARTQRDRRLRYRRTGWIGVEVGTGAIKIAQVERIAGQYRIARSLVVPAKDEPFGIQSIEEGRVGREIRKALSLHGGFRGRLAACALSMHSCELRTLVSARGSEDEQRELISLELDDTQAANAEQREFEFWDSAQRPEDEQGDDPSPRVVDASRAVGCHREQYVERGAQGSDSRRHSLHGVARRRHER